MKGCFVNKEENDQIAYVYKMGRREKFEKELEILGEIVTEKNINEHKEFLRETEVIITTWNFIPFTEIQINEFFPKLRLVLYGAGSVQYFARPFLNRGIRVVSGWAAMAIPVAEFTESLILLANKGFFQCILSYKKEGFYAAKELHSFFYPGNFETKIGILGIGMIGSELAKRLKESNLEILAYDPYLSDEKAKVLNVKKASIEELFSSCQVITNHMALNSQTKGMLDYHLFSLMGDYASFINTAQAASIIEADLIRALREKPTRTAVIDVTEPEPVLDGSELLNLPNVFLTPHIAGYANKEVLRLSDYMLDELKRFKAGEKLLFEVTLPMLETLA